VSSKVTLSNTSMKSPGSSNGNNNKPAVANKILQRLPRKEYKAVLARTERVDLPIHTVLNEIGKAIEHGYFMNSGLASILTVLAGGKSVEVGLAGTEGFVGVPLVDVRVKFIAPSTYGDQLRAETTVTEIRNSSFVLRHQFFKGDVLAVEGFETRVWAERDSASPGKIRSRKIPHNVIEKLSSEPAK